jgi:hypothetical protein
VDVVDLCRDLIRIDTSNPGSTEKAAAEYVTRALEDAGVGYETFEPAPGRVNVVATTPGSDSSLPKLALHGHLDVVPADPAGWTHSPFAGEVAGGMLFGRGAVDMKDFIAMMLAVQLDLARSGRKPRRDLVCCYLADEETGSVLGARWLAEKRPELVDGVGEALGEVGGFSVTLPGGARAYRPRRPLQRDQPGPAAGPADRSDRRPPRRRGAASCFPGAVPAGSRSQRWAGDRSSAAVGTVGRLWAYGADGRADGIRADAGVGRQAAELQRRPRLGRAGR